MKLFNKIFLGAAALTFMGAFSSCKEEATLGGADAVYIEMANPNISMLVGDSLKLSARVSNVSGKEIPAQLTWSVDDESVVKLISVVDTVKVKNPTPAAPAPNPGSPEDEGDENNSEDNDNSEDNGEDQQPASRADQAGVPDGYDGMSEDGKILYKFVYTPGIKALPGSQGKSTVVRVTLENGQQAIANVTVGRNKLAGCVQAQKEEMVAYPNYPPNQVCWFDVDPINVVDDYDVSFTLEFLERITEAPEGYVTDFTYPGEGYEVSEIVDNVEHRYPVKDGICIDREGKRIGVVFTAPRLTGKAKLTLKVGNENESATASTTVFLFPRISGGLEYISNGQVKRPGFGDANPSNTKPRQTAVQMDVNSTYLIGVCLGILTDHTAVDVANAIAAEKAGYFKWEVDGSALVVEDMYVDTNYESGYVTYLKVRSGVREGSSRCQFTMPGTAPDGEANVFGQPQTFICDVTVSDFNKSYPVEEIVVTDDYGTEYNEGDLIETPLGRPLRLSVGVEPDASFEFHIPEITSSDPSILEVEPRDAGAGLMRQFTPHKVGTVTLTMKALDVTKTIRVKVNDKVYLYNWNQRPDVQSTIGATSTAKINLFMESDKGNAVTSYDGEVVWTSSDESVATVTANPDKVTAVVTYVGEGTAEITALIDGLYTLSATVNTVAARTTEITDDAYTEYRGAWHEDSWVMILFQTEDGSEHQFGIVLDELAAGHYVGDGDGYYLGDDGNFDDASYDVTITDDGDGNFTINGYFVLANGMRYEFKNATFFLDE